MRYLLMLPLFVLLMTGCAKKDRDQVNGTWKFEEMKSPKGEVMYSADPAEQKKSVDKIIKEQMVMYAGSGITEDMLRKQIEEQFKAIEKATFVFDAKGNMQFKTNSGNTAADTKSTFTMDESKKTLDVKNGEKTEKYTYEFDGDKLKLKGADGSIILKKA